MSNKKYTPDLIDSALKDLKETGDIEAVSEKYFVPKHAIYRFRRRRKNAPEINRVKQIKQLNKELKDKELENQILCELLKKTYQVMPIELESPKNL